jgi:hypothetical protein
MKTLPPLSKFTTYLRIAHNDMPGSAGAAEVTESKASSNFVG